MSVAPDTGVLRLELETRITGEVRFDQVSRALYSTDASVYQIEPLGLVVPRTPDDVVRTVEIARGTACRSRRAAAAPRRPGRRSAPVSILDTSKYLNRILEVNRRGALGVGRAWRRARRAERAAASRTDCASRPTFPPPAAPPRRHDCEQLERRALRALRQDDRPRPRAAASCCRMDPRSTFGRSTPAELGDRCPPATRSRPRCYRAVRGIAVGAPARDRRALSESAASRWRLQPRRVHGSRDAVQPCEDDRRIRRHAGSGRCRQGQSGAAAGGEGRADDRVRRVARRARRRRRWCSATGRRRSR